MGARGPELIETMAQQQVGRQVGWLVLRLSRRICWGLLWVGWLASRLAVVGWPAGMIGIDQKMDFGTCDVRCAICEMLGLPRTYQSILRPSLSNVTIGLSGRLLFFLGFAFVPAFLLLFFLPFRLSFSLRMRNCWHRIPGLPGLSRRKKGKGRGTRGTRVYRDAADSQR